MTLASVTKASEVFRDSVASNFELEADFLNTITELFVKAATPLPSPPRRRLAHQLRRLAHQLRRRLLPSLRFVPVVRLRHTMSMFASR
jgi:hypothetical protein